MLINIIHTIYLLVFLIAMIIPGKLEYMCQSNNKKEVVALCQFHSLNLLSNSDWELLIPNRDVFFSQYCCTRT